MDCRKRPRKNKEPRVTSFSFRFPFVTDAINNSIKQLFEKYEIPARLVNPRGQILLNFAQERKPSQRTCRSSICPQRSICQRSSVVYEATCQLYGSSYIGMTSRRLHDRMREHMASARKDEKQLLAFTMRRSIRSRNPRSASPPCLINETNSVSTSKKQWQYNHASRS